MSINNLFKDCGKIAVDYGQDIADVVTQFTLIELKGQVNNENHSYKFLIKETADYFRSVYGSVGYGKKEGDIKKV
jgi:hypothetical protein